MAESTTETTTASAYKTLVSPPIPPFWAYTLAQPTIPKLYWDVRSQEQRILNIFELLDRIINYSQEIGMAVDDYIDDIQELKDEFDKYKNGAMLDFYETQLMQWINDHMDEYMQRALQKWITVGINDDGYLVVYRPDSWKDIWITWGPVYGRSDYGRIVLQYDTGSSGIDNTYDYSLAQTTSVQKLIADLEVNAKRTDACYDALFTNLDTEVTKNGDDN